MMALIINAGCISRGGAVGPPAISFAKYFLVPILFFSATGCMTPLSSYGKSDFSYLQPVPYGTIFFASSVNLSSRLGPYFKYFFRTVTLSSQNF